MSCSNCGAPIPLGSRFCASCGTPAPAAAPPPPAPGSACPSCRTPLPDGYRFCPSCGATLTPATTVAPPPGASRAATSRTPLLAGGIAVAAVVVIGAIVLLTRDGDGKNGGQPLAGQVTPAATSAATATATATVTAAATVSATRTATAPSSASVRFDVARATELTRAALPVPADLPGQGWDQREYDPEDDDDDNLSLLFDERDGGACGALARRSAAIWRQIQTDRAAWAGREFHMPDRNDDDQDAYLGVYVTIYRGAGGAALDRIVADVRGVLTDRDAPSCIGEEWTDYVAVTPVAAYASAPQGGMAQAFEIAETPPTPSSGRSPSPSPSGRQPKIRAELVYWRYGNALVWVLAAGGPNLSRDVMRAAVNTTQANLERIARTGR